jgi:hypothetical protein
VWEMRAAGMGAGRTHHVQHFGDGALALAPPVGGIRLNVRHGRFQDVDHVVESQSARPGLSGARRVVGAADAMARRRTTHPDGVKISISLVAFRFLLTPAARGLGLASQRAATLGRLGLLVLRRGHVAHREVRPIALLERLVRIVG